MTVLITGGAGFIGSHVAEKCKEIGHQVIVIDNLSGGFSRNLPDDIIFYNQSILNYHFIQTLFKAHDIDYVYHLAAYAAEGLSHHIRRFNYENNLIGSVNLINESIKNKVKCFVFVSSVAAINPIDPYGIAKYAVELDLRAAHNYYGLDYIIYRPHNVYGERQNIGDKYRNVIGIFMNQIMKNKGLTVFGDGEQTRQFTYIDDISSEIATPVRSRYNKIWNIGSDVNVSINQLIQLISSEFNKAPKVKYLNARQEHKHIKCDHSIQIKDTPLKEGIKRMADWVKINGSREINTFDNIEIRDKLPDGWK